MTHEFMTLTSAHLSDYGCHEADDDDNGVVRQILQNGQLRAQPVRQARHLAGF
jgi:hypothetical protein